MRRLLASLAKGQTEQCYILCGVRTKYGFGVRVLCFRHRGTKSEEIRMRFNSRVSPGRNSSIRGYCNVKSSFFFAPIVITCQNNPRAFYHHHPGPSPPPRNGKSLNIPSWSKSGPRIRNHSRTSTSTSSSLWKSPKLSRSINVLGDYVRNERRFSVANELSTCCNALSFIFVTLLIENPSY